MFNPDDESQFVTDDKNTAKNYVKFYRQWVKNKFKSEQEGREVGETQDFILIISPGMDKTEVRRRVNEADKMQYPQEWFAFQQGKENQVSGTPIELLPGIGEGVADMLKAIYIYTIEQLAGLGDLQLQRVGMGGNELRSKAKAYLSKSSAEVVSVKEQLEALKDQLKKQSEELEQLRNEKANRKKPGPKPKVK